MSQREFFLPTVVICIFIAVMGLAVLFFVFQNRGSGTPASTSEQQSAPGVRNVPTAEQPVYEKPAIVEYCEMCRGLDEPKRTECLSRVDCSVEIDAQGNVITTPPDRCAVCDSLEEAGKAQCRTSLDCDTPQIKVSPQP